MARPTDSAQGDRTVVMLSRRTLHAGNCLILNVFALFGLLALATLGAGCGVGESGLVLGRRAPPLSGGSGGVSSGGSSGDDSPGSSGGARPGGAGATSGEAGAPFSDMPWVSQRCTPSVEFENVDTSSQGELFNETVPEPAELVLAAAHDACRVLYRSGSEVKVVSNVTLIVEDYPGIASTSGTTVRLSTSYLQGQYDSGVDLAREIAGIMRFTISLMYQHDASGTAPGWLMTGVADFVRLESGLIERSERAQGGNYDSSSQGTAFFLDYLTTLDADFVYRLNLRFAPGEAPYEDSVFVSLAGSDLNTLWAQYQATL
jgi:hypothetical protein